MGSTCTNLLLCPNSAQQNYRQFFKDFKQKVNERINETNITTEKAFNLDLFGMEGNHKSNGNENPGTLNFFTCYQDQLAIAPWT